MTVLDIGAAMNPTMIKDLKPARRRSRLAMLSVLVAVVPLPAVAQAIQAGAWDVTSTVVELGVPGVPGFIRRMAQGRSKAEHKRLIAGEGLDTLLAPDPKARCRVGDQRIANGRYQQALTCPQKQGEALNIVRSGTYDAAGFVGRATVTGTTPRGPINIVLDQRARRTGK